MRLRDATVRSDMTWIALRFWLPLALVAVYAWARGGQPEKIVATLLVTAGIASLLLERGVAVRFTRVELGIALVDLLLFTGLTLVAVYANRFWPIILSGLQAMSLLGHFGKWWSPELWRLGYAIMIQAPAYPGLLVLIIGVARHRARIRQNGVDASWQR